jgi:hypothetical protein
MAGHRRIAQRLFQKYRKAPTLTHLLLAIDYDRARGLRLTARAYARLHRVAWRTAARMLEEYEQRRGDLEPVAARRSSGAGLRETGDRVRHGGDTEGRTNPKPGRGVARKRGHGGDTEGRTSWIRNQSKKKSAPGGARTVTRVTSPEGAPERAPDPEARRTPSDPAVDAALERELAKRGALVRYQAQRGNGRGRP